MFWGSKSGSPCCYSRHFVNYVGSPASGFLTSYLESFLCSRIPGHVVLRHRDSLGASRLWQFLRLFFVFHTLDALKDGYPGVLGNVHLSEPFDLNSVLCVYQACTLPTRLSSRPLLVGSWRPERSNMRQGFPAQLRQGPPCAPERRGTFFTVSPKMN